MQVRSSIGSGVDSAGVLHRRDGCDKLRTFADQLSESRTRICVASGSTREADVADPDVKRSDRTEAVPAVPAPDGEAQPASDGAAPIDDSAVPPLTNEADTKGG